MEKKSIEIVSICTGKCPIPNTHSRLDQAHELWHQSLLHYEDPNGFLANLNSTVEALRNVTFMLQNEKQSIPQFDSWYSEWQERLRSDRVLSWLSSARTTVVHKSDLEIESYAIGTVHNNQTFADMTKRVHPVLSTAEAVKLIAAGLPKEFHDARAFLVLSIERKWSISDLQGEELLDALAHCYAILSQLVQSAHKVAGSSYYFTGHGNIKIDKFDRILPCMMLGRESRTVRLSLADNTLLTPISEKRAPGAKDIERAVEKYKLVEGRDSIDLTDDLIESARSILAMAKRILKKDKYHSWILFLRTPKGWKIHQLIARDRQEKYAIIRHMATEIGAEAVDAVIEVSENWIIPEADLESGELPEESKKRREAIAVTAFDSSGLCRSIIAPFRRSILGNIVFSGSEEMMESMVPYYFAPVFEVWNLPLPTQNSTG